MRLVKRTRGLWRRLMLLLLPALFLVGCWDRHDPDKMAWVMAVGIDTGPRGDYVFSFQLPAIPGGGGGGGLPGGQSTDSGGGAASTEVFAFEAPDIITALDGIQSFIARRMNLSQAKVVILSEDVARSNVDPVIAQATRFPEFRRNTSLMVCRCKAYDFMRKAKPRLEANVSLWYELLLLTPAQTGIIPQTRVNDFVLAGQMPGVGARAILVGLRPDIEAGTEHLGGEDQHAQTAPPTAGSPLAGDVRRLGQIPVEFMGAAIFKGGKVRGYLGGDESRFLSMLHGDFTDAAMAFVDPNSPDRRLVLRLLPEGKPQLRITWQGMQVHVDFTVPLGAELLSQHSATDYTQPKNRVQLESAVAREIQDRMSPLLDKTLHQWGTDLYYIGNRLRTFFPTVKEWEQFNWSKRVSDTAFTVHVKIRVHHYGLATKPIQSKE